jgi:excisionase family DNA binding protein
VRLSDRAEVLTIEEAAEVLRIGRSAAYEAARRGELPAVRIGRTVRVPRRALEALLGAQEDESPGRQSRALEATAGQGRDAPAR